MLTAGWLLSIPAGAQPPSKLTDHLTDSAGVLTDPGRATVNAAIDRLYRDRHIQLWVVYVDNFSQYQPDNWAGKTRSASGLSDHDALLGIAVNTKKYTFTLPQGPTAAELNRLRHNQIEPVLGAKDWSGTAVAAADGLDKLASANPSTPASPSKPVWPQIAIAVVIVVAVVIVALLVLSRARRRRRTRATGGHTNIEGGGGSSAQALSTADARLRQISDYVARHRDSVGAEAQARLDEATRHLAAARDKQATNEAEAIAHANRASTLAAQAQTLANDDVLGTHRRRRRRGAQR